MAVSQRLWRKEQERRRRERERRARQRRIFMLIVLLALIAAIVIIVARGCTGGGSSGTDTAAQSGETGVAEGTQTMTAAQYTGEYDISEVNTSYFDGAAFLGGAVADSIYMYNLLDSTDFYTGVNLDVDNVYTTATGYSTTAAADQIKSKKFTKVFLCFGEREIVYDDADAFIDSYEQLVEKIKSYQPSAKIYVIGIQPSTKEASDAELYGMKLSRIKKYNNKIKRMAASEKIYYVDTVAALGTNNGYLPEGVSSDGISLNRGCCIDLLRYITKKASIPGTETTASEDDEDDEDGEDEEDAETVTQKPSQSTSATDEPEPTVNVRKDNIKND